MYGWVYTLVAIIFLALSGWFIFMYYSNSERRWKSKNKFYKQDMQEGSYQGFWTKNKWNIIMFMAFVFLILFFGFLVAGIQLMNG